MSGSLTGRTIEFFVTGKPEPKGSAKAFVIPRPGLTGKQAGTAKRWIHLYRTIVTSANDALKAWAKLVNTKASNQMIGDVANEGPMSVECTFYLERPESVSERKRAEPIVKPDLDKLIRGVLDGLTGTCFVDDAQVVRVVMTKEYAPFGRPAGVRVVVEPFIKPGEPHQEGLL